MCLAEDLGLLEFEDQSNTDFDFLERFGDVMNGGDQGESNFQKLLDELDAIERNDLIPMDTDMDDSSEVSAILSSTMSPTVQANAATPLPQPTVRGPVRFVSQGSEVAAIGRRKNLKKARQSGKRKTKAKLEGSVSAQTLELRKMRFRITPHTWMTTPVLARLLLDGVPDENGPRARGWAIVLALRYRDIKLEGIQAEEDVPTSSSIATLFCKYYCQIVEYLLLCYSYISQYKMEANSKDVTWQDWPKDIQVFMLYIRIPGKKQSEVEALLRQQDPTGNALAALKILQRVHRKQGKTISKQKTRK